MFDNPIYQITSDFHEICAIRKPPVSAFKWCKFRQNPMRSDRVNQPAQWGVVIKFRNFAIGFGAALFSDIFKTKNELGKLFFVFFCIISKPKLSKNILGGNFESQINKTYYFRDNLGTQINKNIPQIKKIWRNTCTHAHVHAREVVKAAGRRAVDIAVADGDQRERAAKRARVGHKDHRDGYSRFGRGSY